MIIIHDITLDKALEIKNNLGDIVTIGETSDPYEMVKQDKDIVCNLIIDNERWFVLAYSKLLKFIKLTLGMLDGNDIIIELKNNQYRTIEIL